ncbi:MAG TPA: cryptochrome/photolyase family protein [bacterium]|nr:cryptochrome/photolyase family protein [bacterium]
MRNLVVILGDQLDRHSAVFDAFDPSQDMLWMAEVAAESTHVWSHKARIALFLAAMRHFAADMRARDWPLEYLALEQHDAPDLASALQASLKTYQPDAVHMVRAGDIRVQTGIEGAIKHTGIALHIVEDRHFVASLDEFAQWSEGRKQLRLEYWYRDLRKRTGLLMAGEKPLGGAWNFDAENRGAFDGRGPGFLPVPLRFPPDEITREVLDLVRQRFASHPGQLDDFDWPVTPEQAEQVLDGFVEHRLPLFGQYQDAMWTQEPWLYHSRLSAALNLKLIDPMHACRAAEAAYHAGHAPLAAVEGFIRQILGWREYVRGLYHLWMPEWLDWNALDAHQPLPAFFWTGETDMACLRDTLHQTLRYGYAHHIQRLMVSGLFCLLLGVEPRRVHEWYLAVYVDAVEWVELPNVLGMSQHADGGRMASKPYIASGKYIERMSNYCAGCRFKPDTATGEKACPITTLYWDFLQRHQERYARHPRLAQQVRNLVRKSDSERHAITAQAEALRKSLAGQVDAE